MTSHSSVISPSLVDRVCQRAARVKSEAGVPLIVLDEMQAAGSHHLDLDDVGLESAKVLLVAAYRSVRDGVCNT
ncbi:MAG: hypothetical protein O3B13_03070 [Planctomycetota bacterium]|nr:hypothetical protein [Planctomycetota bacterium]MDA1162063.1 hypothetical protein [Planctomycetota bacterium]